VGAASYGLIVTIVALVAIAVFILLFERRRAREIEHDLSRPSADEESQSPDA